MKNMKDSEYIDPRIIKTQRSIMLAFSELMQEKPFQKISISNIAERALINRSTFYAHFESIEDLLNNAIRIKFDKSMAEWLPNQPVFNEQNLHNLAKGIYYFLGNFIGQCSSSPGVPPALPLMQTQIQPAINNIVENWLANTGMIEEQMIKVQSGIISWAIFGGALRWSENPNAPSIDLVVDKLVESLLHGTMISV